MVHPEHMRKAQTAAKTYLEMRGYEIVEQNWRQSAYKIDIVAKKDDVLCFVEVRYHASSDRNSLLQAVTASKLKQRQKAASSWLAEYKWPGKHQLLTVEIDESNFAVLSFVDNEL